LAVEVHGISSETEAVLTGTSDRSDQKIYLEKMGATARSFLRAVESLFDRSLSS
jgi:hypothetical protein